MRESGDGIDIDLLVVPRASREKLGPLLGDRVKVSVTAPPVEGAANDAVVALLARLLGVPRGSVRIVRGETGRRKTARIQGVPLATVERLVGEPA